MTKQNTHAGHLQPRISSTRCRLRSSTLPNRPLPVRDTISTTDCTLDLKPSSPRSSSPSALRAHGRRFSFKCQIYLGELILRCKFNIHTHADPLAPRYPATSARPCPARPHATQTLSRLPAGTSPPAPRLAATLVTAYPDRPAFGPPIFHTRPPPPPRSLHAPLQGGALLLNSYFRSGTFSPVSFLSFRFVRSR